VLLDCQHSQILQTYLDNPTTQPGLPDYLDNPTTQPGLTDYLDNPTTQPGLTDYLDNPTKEVLHTYLDNPTTQPGLTYISRQSNNTVRSRRFRKRVGALQPLLKK
jgi:hypothetical protein